MNIGQWSKLDTQKRERLLLIVAGVVLLIIAVPFLRSLYNDTVNLQKQRQKLQTDIVKYQNEAGKKDEIKKRLTELTNQSLPSRDDAALSQYQNYLMDLARTAGIKEYRGEAPSVVKQKNQYSKFSFTIHGKGSLEQIAEFLRQFQKTPYLHLVRSVSPRPTKKPDEFDVSIKIEALSLPQSRSNKTLPEVPAEVIAVAEDEKALLKAIKDRALFSEYQPQPNNQPPEPEKPKLDTFDMSPFCYLTAIVEPGEKYQCWINNRIENKTYILSVGEMFKLGDVRCFVKKIEFDRVQFEAAGGLYTIRIGKSFAEFE
ncbi:hypothetical protein FACS1894170_04040 [Planctomycetales bacterium]|nr:hypothetical protein FACS1894170_04040 [Planctomycetales bacterium]